MPRTSRRLLLALTFVSLPLAGALGFAQARSEASQSGLELTAINRKADPCTDFYSFACGDWLNANPIPADRSRWGRFDEVKERNDQILRTILESAAGGRDASSRRIGDYYASCIDEAAIDRKGASPLDGDFRRIDALRSAADLPALLADLHVGGVNAFFNFGAEADFKDASHVIATADQGGLGLPDRDYYFKDDPKSVELRKAYVEHVARLLGLTGIPADRTAAAAEAVMRIETALAKPALDNVARRNPTNLYHKMPVRELQQLAPRFEWTKYIESLNAPTFVAVNVAEPDFFKGLNQVIEAAPLADLKTYLRWQVAHATAFILSKPFVDENFRFYGATLQGTKELLPRWKRCVQYTDSDLGEALGEAFVKQAFGAEGKTETLKMVRALEGALERDISGLDWMTDTTRRRAIDKLHAIENKIGYPDRWRDYSRLQVVRGDAYGNSRRANVFESHRQLAKIGKAVDKSEWQMTPPTVNAYYQPLENNVNFPAGILQPPFFNAKADAAVNFGAAGAVIGHELTHGFDDEGRQFDGGGNLNDWWTEADSKAFEERTSCVVDQYSSYTAVDEVKLNGKLTLGENTADNGGVRIALMAYLAGPGASAPTLDGFTPEQRFFLGWGQIWCENRRPEVARMRAQTDPHSPGQYRVNGVVSNMPEFQKAFSCKADAPMVRPKMCRVW